MIRRALYRLTAGLRCRLISRDGRPYLERYYLGRIGPVTAYLHRFVGRDGDEETHDHPWRAASLVLAGGYREERARLNGAARPQIRLRRVRWANALALHSLHRIAETEPDAWTLFVHGPRRKGWGFVRYLAPTDGTRPATLYHQPFPPWRGEDWAAAPLGRDAGRQPIGEGA